MNITRRKFLKWSGISALGTIVFSACGIPERELLVESAAQMPEDLVSGLEAWYATSCAQCGAGEGIIVRVIEGRAIKIEGNPDHPISQGKSSAGCQAGLQALYNPDRLTSPMRRVGNQRSSEFEHITWPEAMSDLAGILKSQSPGSAVMVTEPLRGTLGMVARKFADSSGAKLLAHEPMEQTTLRAAIKEVFGQARLPDFDIAHSDYVLSFGADMLGTWLSPVRYSRAYGEFRQVNASRGTLVQVEPRMSLTAANADRWVYVNPGWEGVLALSVAYVLMSQHADRIDRAAVTAMTGGAGAAYLAEFAPEKVASSVGASAERIDEIARGLSEHKRSLVIGGGSAGAHTKGKASLSAIYSLNLLLGNVGKEGGVLFNPPSPLDDVPATSSGASLQEWESLVGKMQDRAVKVLLVHGANPVYGLPASLGMESALEKVDKIVSFSSFMDETTARADLILPDHVYLESWGDDVPDPGPGYQTVTFQQPVVYPFHRNPGTHAFGDVLLETAAALGGPAAQALPWPNMREALRANARRLHALNRGSVQATDFEVFWNAALQRGGWWDASFKGTAQAAALPLLPRQRQAVEPEFEGPSGKDTFYLLPFSSHSLMDGRGANLPWLQATPDPVTTAAWHTWAEINVKSAEEMGIREGDELELESPAGKVKALAYIHPAAAPGVISVPTGQGHSTYGSFELGPDWKNFRTPVAKGRGDNLFKALALRKDKDTGALAWAATRVRVTKTGKWTRLSKLEGVVTPELNREAIPLVGPE